MKEYIYLNVQAT